MAYPPPRKTAFVLLASDQGTFIINRFDFKVENDILIGVGGTLMHQASYDRFEAEQIEGLLHLRRQAFGDGVVAVDAGANIGVFTVQWAKAMTGWGTVLAVEPQERLYYALAGNIALNNCLNARAAHAALGAEVNVMAIPQPNYESYGSFGSFELRDHPDIEAIGQDIDYTTNLLPVQIVTVDSFALPRLDLLKIDVERMELEVLQGAAETIQRHLPIIVVESLKTDATALNAVLDGYGYHKIALGGNILAIHPSDPTLKDVN